MAIGYVISCWLLLQVADLAFDIIGTPDWAIRSIATLMVLGLPIVFFFSWAYEVTPEGIKREKEVDRSESITQLTGRKLDRVIIPVLLVALAYFAYDKFTPDTAPHNAQPEKISEVAPLAAELDSVQGHTEKSLAGQPTANGSALNDTPTPTVNALSIAVLPFADMSQAGDQQYFSDGIAEEILNDLAHVSELHVTSRSSSFTFREKNLDIPSIGAQLGVAYIVEGSVRKAGNTLRITAQLIEATGDKHLWSQTYDRELNDIFAIQDELSLAIVDALKTTLGLELEPPEQTRQAFSTDIYDMYLKGLHAYNEATVDSLVKAKAYFEQAIALRPGYYEAWYQLARTRLKLLGNYNGKRGARDIVTPHSNFERTEAAALKAIELNPNIGGAHIVLSLIYPWDHVKTLELRTKAIGLSPNDSFVILHYGRALEWLGRAEEADRYLQQGILLDPHNLENRHHYARFQYSNGGHSKALTLIEDLLATNPEYAPAWKVKSLISIISGDLVTAVISLRYAMELDPSNAAYKKDLIRSYFALEDMGAARYWLDRLLQEHPDNQDNARFEFDWLWLNGQTNEALQMARSQVEVWQDPGQSYFHYQLYYEDQRRGRYTQAEAFLVKSPDYAADFMEWPIATTQREFLSLVREDQLNIGSARELQFIYSKTGNQVKSDALLKRLHYNGLNASWNTFGLDGSDYVREARKLLREGLTDQALTALETAVNIGYRQESHDGPVWQVMLRDSYGFIDIRYHPRFLALLDTISADTARQRDELAAQFNDEPSG